MVWQESQGVIPDLISKCYFSCNLGRCYKKWFDVFLGNNYFFIFFFPCKVFTCLVLCLLALIFFSSVLVTKSQSNGRKRFFFLPCVLFQIMLEISSGEWQTTLFPAQSPHPKIKCYGNWCWMPHLLSLCVAPFTASASAISSSSPMILPHCLYFPWCIEIPIKGENN